ncbi:radical S-adenosyl methionine domain-containing protein 1, mitochondrial-like [Haliotis rubra]|uniref:radical S-adenosyl methionine domain-containing protein 1, mitochondrial-like n=1 Tax=Haliotis rubra TaxID=36100 RepID=UPI001EE580DF|nr:radical S-adenosyl methionine domain-containing protein 1, mitochondrial-like [Haliotis rubra]XP_046554537.1 radical S-adenosyl methionine domain-containing protein 1, mitochondrial-like [Haliotis rubra]
MRSKHLSVIHRCRSLSSVPANGDQSFKLTHLKAANIDEEEHKYERRAALYVHWPYCKRRCTYCNFNKYINRNVEEVRMRDNLVRETKNLIKLSGVSAISSIFFGGGTPSLVSADTIASIINQVKAQVTLPKSGEITLEANPTSLETSRLREFRDAGVNRLSIGVQSLRQDDLSILGRDHTVEEAVRCISEARALFPDRVSVDVMFGRPGQTVQAWIAELQQVIKLCDKHLSLYQLTLERGTQLFKDVSKHRLRMPSPDDVATMYKAAVQILFYHEYKRYEVSNFAKQEAYSTHNLTYWTGMPYIGVGPGAHGRFNVAGARQARIQTLEPDIWMREVEAFGHATRKIVPQTLLDHLEEILAVGLRTCWGISHDQWGQVSPLGLQDIFHHSETIQTYRDHGLLQLDTRGLRASESGLDVLDTMIPSLLLELDLAYKTNVT